MRYCKRDGLLHEIARATLFLFALSRSLSIFLSISPPTPLKACMHLPVSIGMCGSRRGGEGENIAHSRGSSSRVIAATFDSLLVYRHRFNYGRERAGIRSLQSQVLRPNPAAARVSELLARLSFTSACLPFSLSIQSVPHMLSYGVLRAREFAFADLGLRGASLLAFVSRLRCHLGSTVGVSLPDCPSAKRLGFPIVASIFLVCPSRSPLPLRCARRAKDALCFQMAGMSRRAPVAQQGATTRARANAPSSHKATLRGRSACSFPVEAPSTPRSAIRVG